MVKELNRAFWKLLVCASECVPFPHFQSFQAKSTQTCFGEKAGSGDQSLRKQIIAISVPARLFTRRSRLLSQGGGGEARHRAAAAEFEYYPSHGPLISLGFLPQEEALAAPFQGAVAPVPGRGVQEIASGARQA